MSPQVYFDGHYAPNMVSNDVSTLKCQISQQYGVPVQDLFVTINGKIISDEYVLETADNVIRVCTKLAGGKGGFGSMLRAIGAQIEKTTNREACRDLSGRRLRDINEEKRLRKWLEGQEEREKEAIERKQKKLERLLAEPKIDVNLNPSYEKERQELPERVSAAVDAGWNAAGTSETKEGSKRKAEQVKAKPKKKKLWIDADLSDCSSISDDDDGEEQIKASPTQTTSTDSGHDSDQTDASNKKD